ncbi:MAG: thioredoxin family protein [Candidatus Thermoplasmatota archaeon]|nr:thioredoxin family protein [Candidatus Thermoplasmatota archaeon]
MKHILYAGMAAFLTLVAILFLLLFLPSGGETIVEYYYMEGCGDCEETTPIIKEIEKEYSVNIKWISVNTQEGLEKWNKYNFTEVPAVVINGEEIPKGEITKERLVREISL